MALTWHDFMSSLYLYILLPVYASFLSMAFLPIPIPHVEEEEEEGTGWNTCTVCMAAFSLAAQPYTYSIPSPCACLLFSTKPSLQLLCLCIMPPVLPQPAQPFMEAEKLYLSILISHLRRKEQAYTSSNLF